MTKENICVWFELPVSDLSASRAFYEKATGHSFREEQADGKAMLVFEGKDKAVVAGHLYEGKSAANGEGPTIHLAVDGTAEEATQRAKDAGGTIVSPVIEIPAGRFVYCNDLDGNSIGLFTS
ncbi:VOC family protein [Notoacmeibacter sp. MSK16QG-6]|uniref:VOC family protein n=1 Tax=Notoacmeibacter sp. MSK16QG-6 TaxID=2957982 RepID=UPI0020A0C153|nr:VOC family protein [Notoacmeibacter sp. MSK16QG-6]MCP1200162.1 VOC family protein [Notoacmeibacter sp. MSK16QG-6]